MGPTGRNRESSPVSILSTNQAVQWPFTLPAPGTIGTISTNVLADVAAVAGQATADNSDVSQMAFQLTCVVTNWCTGAVSLIKSGSTVVDFIYWLHGGGHGDSGCDGLYAFRGSTGKFEVMSKPVHWLIDTTGDLTNGEYIVGNGLNHPDTDHAYDHNQGLNSDEPNGPAFFKTRSYAMGQTAAACDMAHKFDLASKTWARMGASTLSFQGGTSAYVKDPTRNRFLRVPANNGQALELCDYSGTRSYPTESGFRAANFDDTKTPTGIYDPVSDLYIIGNFTSGHLGYYDPTNLAAGFTDLTLTGSVPSAGTSFFSYDKSRDVFYFIDNMLGTDTRAGGFTNTTLYICTPPPLGTRKTGNWVFTTRTFTGTSLYSNGGGTIGGAYKRFQYIDVLDAIIVCTKASGPMECWKL